MQPKPNVKWGVGTVTETEPKLHFRSVSAPKLNFGWSLPVMSNYLHCTSTKHCRSGS